MKYFLPIAILAFSLFTGCEEDVVQSEMKDVETAGDEAVRETQEAIEALEQIGARSTPGDVEVAEALAAEAEAAVEVLEAEAKQTAEALSQAVSEAKAKVGTASQPEASPVTTTSSPETALSSQ